MKKQKKLSELIPDNENINKHSEYGMHLLDKSVEEIGWTEGIVISSDDVVMSGNARTEVGVSKGFEDAILVETDGKRPVVIKRTDIKSSSKEFAKAKILSNTVSKHNYVEDAEVAEAVCQDYNLDGEALGLEEGQQGSESTQIKKVAIEPYEQTHVLLSFPPDKLVLLQKHLEQIALIEGVEIEQSSN